MYIKELTNQEFINFTNTFNDKSIYQTPEYAFVMNKQHYDTVFLGLIDNDNIVGASLILIEKSFGFKYAYAPRGFLIDYNNNHLIQAFTEEIKKYLGKNDIIAIKINPLIIKNVYNKKLKIIEPNAYYENIFNNLKRLDYYHMGYNNKFEAYKPRYEAIINLDIPYYMLFKNIRKEFRAKIRNAEKNGIKIYRGNETNLEYLYLHTKHKYPRDLKYFKDVYSNYQKRDMIEFYYAKLDTSEFLKVTQNEYAKQDEINNYLNQQMISSKSSSHKLLNSKLASDKLLEKYKGQIVTATEYLKNYPEGIVMASILIVKNQDEVHLLIDGYDKKYSSFNAKHLLVWKLIEKYSNLGFKKFNLGGVSNIKESSEYNGLNEFKISFNAKVYEYIGDLELITNNTLYFMYKQSAPIRNILKK